MEAIQREISNIRFVIAETNNEIHHIKEIISPVSDMSKDVAVLKSVVSVLKTDVFEIKELITDVAVMKNDIGHLRGYLKIITGLLIGIFIAVAAGVLGNIIQGWLNQ